MRRKSETLQILANAVLALEIKRGHLRWKVTELNAATGFSRTTIYQYLGDSKEEMLRSALRLFLDWFYGPRDARGPVDWRKQIAEVRKFLLANPAPILFYQKWRASPGTWPQAALRESEQAFREKLGALYPHLTPAQILIVHALLHGLVTAPFVSPRQAGEGAAELERILGK